MNQRFAVRTLVSLLILISLLLSACQTLAPMAAPSATEAPAAAAPAVTDVTCGTEPVVLNAYFETGFDLPLKLSEEFTKQYPNVTWTSSRISSPI